MTDFKTIETLLSEVLSLVSQPLTAAGLGLQVEDIQVLLEAGEYGVALEQLCSHIDELKLPLSTRIYTLIERAGTLMGMNPTLWKPLQSQISPS